MGEDIRFLDGYIIVDSHRPCVDGQKARIQEMEISGGFSDVKPLGRMPFRETRGKYHQSQDWRKIETSGCLISIKTVVEFRYPKGADDRGWWISEP